MKSIPTSSPESAIRRVGLCLVSTLALSGCGGFIGKDMTNVEFNPEDHAFSREITVANGWVEPKTNFRNDPYRIETLEGDLVVDENSCAKLGAAVVVTATRSIEAMQVKNDPNGPYVAFPLQELPEQIRNTDCKGDKDGLIWVAKSYLNASVAPITPTSTDVGLNH